MSENELLIVITLMIIVIGRGAWVGVSAANLLNDNKLKYEIIVMAPITLFLLIIGQMVQGSYFGLELGKGLGWVSHMIRISALISSVALFILVTRASTRLIKNGTGL